MSWPAELLRRFSLLLRRGEFHRELEEEMQLHIDLRKERNIEDGLTPSAAGRAAYMKFGNQQLMRESTWKQNTFASIDTLWRDVAYAARTLVRAPVFTAIALLVLALGIGSTVALYTVVHSVLLKPLPFPEQDRLASIHEASAEGNVVHNSVAAGTFKSWQQNSQDFEQLALAYFDDMNLSGSGGTLPERIRAEFGSWNLLSTLGVQPVIGRDFTAEDDRPGAAATTIITWDFWKRRFAGDPSVLGSTILLNGRQYTIIGVLPAGLRYPDVRTELWVTIYPQIAAQDLQYMDSHDAHNFQVIGRLKPGIPFAHATAELSGISAQVEKQFANNPWVFDAANVQPLVDALVSRDMRTAIYALFAASGCLLLIACLNIANLLVARAASRKRDTAIRSALGGTFADRLRTQLAESLLLSIAGSALGTTLAYAGIRWLVHMRPDLPRAESIHIDGSVLVATIGIAALCGLLAGLIPALSERDNRAIDVLKESSRSSSGSRSSAHLRQSLLSIEVSLTVVLLIGAGLLLKTYAHLRDVDPGCNTANVLTMDISLPATIYTPAKRILFFDQLLERVRQQPGVIAAAVSTVLPGQGHGSDDGYTIHEDPPRKNADALDADVRFVDPGYFAGMQIALKRGRVFQPQERGARARYAIINESLARQVFAGRDPIGKHIDDINNAQEGDLNPSNEIIGVVADTRDTPATDSVPTIYYPFYGGKSSDGALAIHTVTDPLQFALPVQKIIADMDPNLAVAEVLTLEQVRDKSTADTSFNATLLLVFALLSLVLAAVGLFGVLSYVTSQRASEIGIRIALGASRAQLLRQVLIDGLRPAFYGLLIGLGTSAGLSNLIRSILYQTQPLDPPVFLGVSGMLLLVAVFACLLPAWRSSHLDPMQALRMQ